MTGSLGSAGCGRVHAPVLSGEQNVVEHNSETDDLSEAASGGFCVIERIA